MCADRKLFNRTIRFFGFSSEEQKKKTFRQKAKKKMTKKYGKNEFAEAFASFLCVARASSWRYFSRRKLEIICSYSLVCGFLCHSCSMLRACGSRFRRSSTKPLIWSRRARKASNTICFFIRFALHVSIVRSESHFVYLPRERETSCHTHEMEKWRKKKTKRNPSKQNAAVDAVAHVFQFLNLNAHFSNASKLSEWKSSTRRMASIFFFFWAQTKVFAQLHRKSQSHRAADKFCVEQERCEWRTQQICVGKPKNCL